MTEYKYGVYGGLTASVTNTTGAGAGCAVYVGTAPLVSTDTDRMNYVNKPVKLTNLAQAKAILGTSSDWATYTLMEVVEAHFNSAAAVAPIWVINVKDPTSVSDVTASDIIGTTGSDGTPTGLQAIKLIYQNYGEIPTYIAAPGWSDIPTVYGAMISAAADINGHWQAFVFADLAIAETTTTTPTEGDPVTTTTAIDTIAKAVTWKSTNSYTNERSKVFWPQAKTGDKIYHLSTLALAAQLRLDAENGDVPYETIANKAALGAGKQYFGANATNPGFDQHDAETLTKAGITTVVPWAGEMIFWGDHTAAFVYSGTYDDRVIFDTTVRMQLYLVNGFQSRWAPLIDEPMTRGLKDRILNAGQEVLDSLVAEGALIGEPEISWVKTADTATDIVNGIFRWQITDTPTVPLHAAICSVCYTDAGYSVLTDEGGAD